MVYIQMGNFWLLYHVSMTGGLDYRARYKAVANLILSCCIREGSHLCIPLSVPRICDKEIHVGHQVKVKDVMSKGTVISKGTCVSQPLRCA